MEKILENQNGFFSKIIQQITTIAKSLFNHIHKTEDICAKDTY